MERSKAAPGISIGTSGFRPAAYAMTDRASLGPASG